MRKPIIAGNWKMNMLPAQAVALVQGFWEEISGFKDVEVVVCPPFTDIESVSKTLKDENISVGLGAQNMHWEE